jgi:hypothetical protein
MLGVLLHAPRVPFIAPRQLEAVESIPGRQFLPSVASRTGQSGADFFPSLAKPTVGGLEPLAHWTLSGAHRTVRCPLLTVGSATRRARITRPTVGWADCWLTGQSGGPPDSPVIYSRTPPTKPESIQLTDASLAHRTLSGAPPDSPVHPDRAAFWLYIANFSKIVSPVSST